MPGTVCGLYEASDTGTGAKQVARGFAKSFVRALSERGDLGPLLKYGKTWIHVYDPLVWCEVAGAMLRNVDYLTRCSGQENSSRLLRSAGDRKDLHLPSSRATGHHDSDASEFSDFKAKDSLQNAIWRVGEQGDGEPFRRSDRAAPSIDLLRQASLRELGEPNSRAADAPPPPGCINRLRAIHWSDSENSVTSCAEFFAKPR